MAAQQSNLVEIFRKNITDLTLIAAVSGGVDSMVMIDLLNRSGNKVTVAHCNFNLRGDESEDDTQLVKEFCDKNDIVCYVKYFNTLEYAEENKLSIQMAARELRYSWFFELRKQLNYDTIAIAHNSDDQVETFFINLSRGSGLEGLAGIKSVDKERHIIRPLLFASRFEIEKYAVANKIPFRNDSSNASVKYQRNYLRHEIIPRLQKINPSFKESLLQSMNYINDAQQTILSLIKPISQKCKFEKEGRIFIEFWDWIQEPYAHTLLFYLISEFGFHGPQIDQILNAIRNQPGKTFHSDKFSLLIDRQNLIITKDEIEPSFSNQKIKIYEKSGELSVPINLKWKQIFNPESIDLKQPNNNALFDASKLIFPLTLRNWKQGDHFFPLGMRGKKKISDFYVDHKIPLNKKEKIWLLCSGDDIIWVVGYRIDDRYKVTPATQSVFFFQSDTATI